MTGSVGRDRPIASGPLRAIVRDGALRRLEWHGVEVLRGLDAPVRDADWATLPRRVTEEAFDEGEDATRYRQRFRVGDDAFAGEMTVALRADGRLEAAVTLEARRRVETNRAGFTLLHPLDGVAGRPLRVVHPHGRATDTRFPEAVSPGQPAFDVAGLRHEVHGVQVAIDLEGEVFEMEDQRNWTDASFKTYCRPLARRPLPYVVEAGERVRQGVRMTISGEPRRARAMAIATGARGLRAPEILLVADAAWPFAGTPPSRVLARLEGAAPDLGWLAAMDLARGLDLEVVVPAGADAGPHLAALARRLAEAELAPDHVVALPQPYLASHQPDGPWPDGPTPEDCAAACREAFPRARVGTGMLTNFTELNRRPPAPGIGAYVTFSTAAIVHAGDDRSVLETIEALPAVLRSALALSGGRPLRLGLVAIGMRTNPYGAGVAANPHGARMAMARDDPRQPTPFAAAFALAATATAAEVGVEALAIAGLGGPFGTEAGGRPTPLGRLLAELKSLEGADLSPIDALPPGVHGLGGPDGRILLANATLAAIEVGGRRIGPADVAITEREELA